MLLRPSTSRSASVSHAPSQSTSWASGDPSASRAGTSRPESGTDQLTGSGGGRSSASAGEPADVLRSDASNTAPPVSIREPHIAQNMYQLLVSFHGPSCKVLQHALIRPTSHNIYLCSASLLLMCSVRGVVASSSNLLACSHPNERCVTERGYCAGIYPDWRGSINSSHCRLGKLGGASRPAGAVLGVVATQLGVA